ncbi:MAG: DUF6572 domain-containing protein [Chthoniobacteraceae bacterium]
MLSGLDHANVIDVIAYDEKTSEVTLIMRDFREWGGSEKLLFLLQEKINAYLSFALDGEMIEAYPAFVGKAIRLQLDIATAPDARTLDFIGIVREQIAYQGIKFEITIHGQTMCGCGSVTPCGE